MRASCTWTPGRSATGVGSPAAPAISCPRPRDVAIREERYVVPCGARTCDVCGRRWEKDRRVCAVAASEHLEGAVALITVTAPGRDYFGSDDWGLGDSARDRLNDWNRSARRRMSELHRLASSAPRKEARAHGVHWRLEFRSWEFQKRGALHAHLVVPFGCPVQQRCTQLYVSELVARGPALGFGYIMGGDSNQTPRRGQVPRIKPADANAAARYVCKYVASIGHGKDSMRSVAMATAKRGSILYVGRHLGAASGVTMRSLKARRRIWARYPWASNSRADWEAACHVDGAQRRRPPLDSTAVDVIRRKALRLRPKCWVDTTTGEVWGPTLAPSPMQLSAEAPPSGRAVPLAAVPLASVRDHVSRPCNLGPVRTVVVV